MSELRVVCVKNVPITDKNTMRFAIEKLCRSCDIHKFITGVNLNKGIVFVTVDRHMANMLHLLIRSKRVKINGNVLASNVQCLKSDFQIPAWMTQFRFMEEEYRAAEERVKSRFPTFSLHPTWYSDC